MYIGFSGVFTVTSNGYIMVTVTLKSVEGRAESGEGSRGKVEIGKAESRNEDTGPRDYETTRPNFEPSRLRSELRRGLAGNFELPREERAEGRAQRSIGSEVVNEPSSAI